MVSELSAGANHADAGGDLEGEAVTGIWALVAGDTDVGEGTQEDLRVRGAPHPQVDQLLRGRVACNEDLADPAVIALAVGTVAGVSIEVVVESVRVVRPLHVRVLSSRRNQRTVRFQRGETARDALLVNEIGD